MHVKVVLLVSAAILIAGSFNCSHGQAVFAGHQRGDQRPFALGIGMSNFDVDWGYNRDGERRMSGITMTLDADVPGTMRLLKGFGVGIEGRDLNYLRPSDLHRMRQSTILGGPTYTWPYSRNVHPFAKYFWGMGSLSFPPIGHYSHDTRAVQAPGVGLECKLFGALWVRGDYEYQFWPHLFGPRALNPNGFTIATVYDMRRRNRIRY